ncbi:MAG: Fic family protein [Myxococcota bacterium]
MTQRYLDVDERSERLSELIAQSPRGSAEFNEVYDISWIYHENGLEGVVLGYAEIRSAVDNRIISDVSLLPTYQAIKNQKACIDDMRVKAANKRFVVTIPFLNELHTRLVGDPSEAAVYRRDIPIHRTYFHEIAQPSKIEAGLTVVLNYLKARHGTELHPLEFAANVHHRFMRVFPFSDHSGFIGRLLTNFILVRAGYVPAVIHAADRQRYYEALRGSERDFRLFIVEAMENSLENALRFLSGHTQEAPREMRA